MTSHSQPHLQIFTPDQAPNKDSKFHFFPQLAKELRQMIWMHTLIERQRIIHLNLYDLNYIPAADDDAEGTTEFPENGESFWAITNGEAALSFYRVHFPCKLRTVGGLVKWGTVYFNPEHDFLRISAIWSVKRTLFNFMYHLKTTYDPRGIGLLNLVASRNDLAGNDMYLTGPSDPELDGGPRIAFIQIIKNLRKVIFYSTIAVGRQILGRPDISILSEEPVYNRSFPIEAKIPTFDRLPRDPRTIGGDLKQVFIGMSDNRNSIREWYQLLKKWGISCPEIEYKWHIAFEPRETELIFDHPSANEFMQKEDKVWNGYADPVGPFAGIYEAAGLKEPIGAETEKYKNEDLEKAVKPAFGFWLFPIDVLGPVNKDRVWEDEEEVEGGFRQGGIPRIFWDFSENWPELWLANLPGRV